MHLFPSPHYHRKTIDHSVDRFFYFKFFEWCRAVISFLSILWGLYYGVAGSRENSTPVVYDMRSSCGFEYVSHPRLRRVMCLNDGRGNWKIFDRVQLMSVVLLSHISDIDGNMTWKWSKHLFRAYSDRTLKDHHIFVQVSSVWNCVYCRHRLRVRMTLQCILAGVQQHRIPFIVCNCLCSGCKKFRTLNLHCWNLNQKRVSRILFGALLCAFRTEWVTIRPGTR